MDKEELEQRKSGIGASESAIALGLSSWKTPYQLWEEKTGPVIESPDSPVKKRGRLFEPIIRQIYSDETGRAVKMVPTIRSEKYPFMFASPDGYADGGRYVEIKTARRRDAWGEPGTDEIPLTYMLQVQHGLIVTGLAVADVPVAFSLDDIAIYEVPADKELQEMIVEKEAAFWTLVQERIAPEPTVYADVMRRFAQSMPKSVTATDEVLTHIGNLRTVKKQMAVYSELEQTIKLALAKFMGDHDAILGPDGLPIVTWKTQDKKEYHVKASTSRVFRLKGEKELCQEIKR